MIRIILADDHAVMRRGLRLVLEQQKDFQVVGEEEIRLTKEVYGYPSLEPFYVADEALAHFREQIELGKDRGALAEGAAAAYFFGRAAHYVVYVAGLPVVRTLAFVVGLGGQAAMLIAVVAT